MSINLLELSQELVEASGSLAAELGSTDLVQDVAKTVSEVNRPNREKICMFVINLVSNGGHLSQAAMDAGYGQLKKKDGTKRTHEERQQIAGVEATRLLKDDKIFKLYEKLQKQKVLSVIFKSSMSKWHLIMWYYALFHKYKDSERKSNVAIAAFQEISKLAGYYAPEQESADARAIVEKLDELSHGMKTMANLPYMDVPPAVQEE